MTRPVLHYAGATPPPETLQWRWEEDGSVELLIPPPDLWRLAFGPAVGLLAYAAAALATGLFFTAVGPRGGGAVPIVWAVVVVVLVLVACAGQVATLAGLARGGRRPTVIRVTGSVLEVDSPHRPPGIDDGDRRWPRAAVAGVRVDESGAVPALLRFMRLTVLLRDERVFAVRIPWRGGEPLIDVEDRLRAALGLVVSRLAAPTTHASHSAVTAAPLPAHRRAVPTAPPPSDAGPVR